MATPMMGTLQADLCSPLAIRLRGARTSLLRAVVAQV